MFRLILSHGKSYLDKQERRRGSLNVVAADPAHAVCDT